MVMTTEIKFQRPIPTPVINVMKSLRVIGMGTPTIAKEKCRMLFQQDFTSNKIAIVMIDVIRCTSTLISCFGAGLKSATVGIKGDPSIGLTGDQIDRICKIQNVHLEYGGELKGLPIPGGIIGNSPSEAACCELLNNKHLHFESSNFGKTFNEVTSLVNDFKTIGGDVTLYIGSIFNAKAISNVIQKRGYNKVYFVCGGFYNGITLEDEIAAGAIISNLKVKQNEIDDEARTMLLLFNKYNSPEKQYKLLSTNTVAKLLSIFGKNNDIKTILNGEGIPSIVWNKMNILVPFVTWIENLPVITTES